MWVLELHDAATNYELLVGVRIYQHIVVVLVTARSRGKFGNLAHKSVVVHVVLLVPRKRVKVSGDDVGGWAARVLVRSKGCAHAILRSVGCGVVSQKCGDLVVAVVAAFGWRQVHTCHHKVAIRLIGKSVVFQVNLKRSVVHLCAARLDERART